jgi:hypothetical protein
LLHGVAKTFPNQASQSVALDRPAHAPRRSGHPEPRRHAAGTTVQDREQAISRPTAFAKHRVEIRRSLQPMLRARTAGVAGRLLISANASGRQARTALGPAPLEDQPATAAGHAGPETMDAAALGLARLVCAFHGCEKPSENKEMGRV